jgi:predicted dehydrogenase
VNRVRIAVVGCGWWATRVHLPALRADAACDLVAVADADPTRAQRAAARFGVPRWYADHRALLEAERVDGVVVATPPDSHYAIARDCLLAGADVLVEKPMTVAARDARDLLEMARRTGRRLHVGYPYPHCRLARALRDRIAAGALGGLRLAAGVFATSVRPLYQGRPHRSADDALFPPNPETYDDRSRGGGQLYSQVTHVASLLFFVTGLVPVSVQAFAGGDTPRADGWDAVTFRCGETGDAAVGTIAGTGTVGPGSPTVERIELFGDRGHAAYDMARGTLSVRSYDGTSLDDRVESEPERYPREAPCARLVAALGGDAGVLVGGDLGRLTVEFIGAAARSIETGGPVTLGTATRGRT